MGFTAQDVVLDALIELGAYGPGNALAAEDGQFVLGRLNDILDQWSARQLFAYNVTFNLYLIAANHSPHLIGPGLVAPDWAAAQRPLKVIGADLVLDSSNPATDIPLRIVDDAWWLNNRTKSVTADIPTHLYYSPDWPNGSAYLWPVSTQANHIRLEVLALLSGFALLATPFSNPPGYKRALTLTLAEDICGPYQKMDSLPSLSAKAARARGIIQGPNSAALTIETVDSGQPNTRTQGGFNYLTGDIV